jgi:hypothetical protein
VGQGPALLIDPDQLEAVGAAFIKAPSLQAACVAPAAPLVQAPALVLVDMPQGLLMKNINMIILEEIIVIGLP